MSDKLLFALLGLVLGAVPMLIKYILDRRSKRDDKIDQRLEQDTEKAFSEAQARAVAAVEMEQRLLSIEKTLQEQPEMLRRLTAAEAAIEKVRDDVEEADQRRQDDTRWHRKEFEAMGKKLDLVLEKVAFISGKLEGSGSGTTPDVSSR